MERVPLIDLAPFYGPPGAAGGHVMAGFCRRPVAAGGGEL